MHPSMRLVEKKIRNKERRKEEIRSGEESIVGMGMSMSAKLCAQKDLQHQRQSVGPATAFIFPCVNLFSLKNPKQVSCWVGRR